MYTSFSIALSNDKAFKAVVPVFAYIVAGSTKMILERHEISLDTAEKIRNAILHGQWKEAFSQVDNNMVEAFSVCGTPEVCIQKIDRLVKAGVNQIVAGSPLGRDMRNSINMIAADVFPHFKGKVGQKIR